MDDREGQRRGGDPLAAMYVIAAMLLGVGALAVVVLMFVPSGWGEGRDEADLFIPGSGSIQGAPAVLTPAGEGPGVRLVQPGKYVAVIEAFNWSFEPAEVRVPVGAEVTFRMRSAQDYHGIAIAGTSILLSLEQSGIKEAVHTFTVPGEYRFVCSEYCGAGHGGMMGVVIVE